MHLDGGRIQAHGLDADAHDLLALQLLEDLIQHAVLGPAVHAGVDGMPISKAFGHSAPLAALLGDIEQGIQQLQVGQLDVAALPGEAGGNTLILGFGDLHALQHITKSRLSVNTPSIEGARRAMPSLRNTSKTSTPPRFFHSRGVPAPSTWRRIRLRLKAPTCTNCRFRMFSCPRRCVRLMPPVS